MCLCAIPIATAQDTCAGALQVTAGLHVVSAINGSQVPTPICTPNGPVGTNGAGEWYKYIPSDDFTVTVTTSIPQNGSLPDTRVQIYSGTCSSLVCHGGDDDSGDGYTSVATFNVAANNTYYIAFDNRWSSGGFTWQLIENPIVVPPTPTISFTTQNITTINSAYNLCAVDMNNDKRDDLVGVNGNNIRVHFQNEDGTFTVTDFPTTNAQFLPSWSLAAGDYNKDGYNDLVYGSGNGLTFMRSNSTGTGFTQDTPGQYVFCQRTNFIDLNNDGHLDAFSCHDIAPNVYYLNNGNGTFNYFQSTVTSGAYSLGANGGNYGSIWIDYNNDGHQDLFIAKCGSVPPDELHRNNGNGTFSDISVQMNLFDPGQSWSCAWADFDNDGDMDVMVGASTGTHKLKRNDLDLSNTVEEPFIDITAGSGFDTNLSTNIEHVAYDFDNDGFVDILGGGGKIMFNQGNNTFAPIAYSGLSVGAIGDFNDDGFLDIQNGNSIKINSGNSNNWIKFHLQGVQSNSNGIGARIEIHGPWGIQIRDVRSGEGFKYMSSLNTHFGLGQATQITQAIIKWPSGTVDVIENPDINGALFVLEGSSPLAVNSFTSDKFSLYPNPTNDFINFTFDNSAADIKSASIYDLTGRTILINQQISENQLDVRSLSAGTYIVLLKDADGKSFSQKFIRK
ncbi:MAG: VCBS repeat-containing protein [Flavobacterium sp.]|nr:VCBS repeat-containing protein [Flavobacterium sp.]